MAILIKDMDMPIGCVACEFNVGGKCVIMGRRLTIDEYQFYGLYDFGDKVSNDCPLVEIPKGVRLIDTRDVKKHMIPLDFSVQNWISEVDLDIKVPTIFEDKKGAGK